MQIGVESSYLLIISRLQTRDLSFRRSPKSWRHRDCINHCDVYCLYMTVSTFTKLKWTSNNSDYCYDQLEDQI